MRRKNKLLLTVILLIAAAAAYFIYPKYRANALLISIRFLLPSPSPSTSRKTSTFIRMGGLYAALRHGSIIGIRPNKSLPSPRMIWQQKITELISLPILCIISPQQTIGFTIPNPYPLSLFMKTGIGFFMI